MNAGMRLALVLLSLLLLGACSHVSRRDRQQAEEYAEQARSRVVACVGECAVASPLRDLGDAAVAASTPALPRHAVVLLDHGQDSLLARVHLIRSARRTIDLQTFHFEGDDAGRVVLDELRAAAGRGVKVRLLLDQLNSLADPESQAELASFHVNFELRSYNPLFAQAQINPLEYAGAVIFRFRDLNQRMHNKLMLVDGNVAIIGGRNIQDEYFDWNDSYNYRDRDLLVAGPATAAMQRNFDAFWDDHRAQRPADLDDVAQVLLDNRGPPVGPMPPRSARVDAMAAAAGDGAGVFARLSEYLFQVGGVDFFGDLPSKHDEGAQSRTDASEALLNTLSGSERELLLQTPYLVMSRPARKVFRAMHKREQPPRVLVSTNSLAATDAFPVYAMSHKYKRLYLRELGFQIHEYKPFPADPPIDLAAVPGASEALAENPPTPPGSGSRHGPVPLKRAGVRIGLHSKSMVVDEQIGIVGSHNFDPRSDDYNTESLVMVHDPKFATALAVSIRRDMEPGNAWVIAPKAKLPVLSQLNYNLGKASEQLPIFDVWPFPYATSYELKPGCQPVPPGDPGFLACYEPVGDFPEVNLSLKMIYTRIITVFGAGLIPIL
ncbi:MAG: phospholipase D family protein [Arenimonas sp.]|nr:phospholipase D family protein [Arenimonas sp.]